MMLYPNKVNGRLRSWRGRHRHHIVIIDEMFNDELKTVDKYSVVIRGGLAGLEFNSIHAGVTYPTIEAAKSASVQMIRDHLERFVKKSKENRERQVYLRSTNTHNYRHNVENPRVIGIVHFTPENLSERLCFKVKYDSDNKIDYIAYSEFVNGYWETVSEVDVK